MEGHEAHKRIKPNNFIDSSFVRRKNSVLFGTENLDAPLTYREEATNLAKRNLMSSGFGDVGNASRGTNQQGNSFFQRSSFFGNDNSLRRYENSGRNIARLMDQEAPTSGNLVIPGMPITGNVFLRETSGPKSNLNVMDTIFEPNPTPKFGLGSNTVIYNDPSKTGLFNTQSQSTSNTSNNIFLLSNSLGHQPQNSFTFSSSGLNNTPQGSIFNRNNTGSLGNNPSTQTTLSSTSLLFGQAGPLQQSQNKPSSFLGSRLGDLAPTNSINFESKFLTNPFNQIKTSPVQQGITFETNSFFNKPQASPSQQQFSTNVGIFQPIQAATNSSFFNQQQPTFQQHASSSTNHSFFGPSTSISQIPTHAANASHSAPAKPHRFNKLLDDLTYQCSQLLKSSSKKLAKPEKKKKPTEEDIRKAIAEINQEVEVPLPPETAQIKFTLPVIRTSRSSSINHDGPKIAPFAQKFVNEEAKIKRCVEELLNKKNNPQSKNSKKKRIGDLFPSNTEKLSYSALQNIKVGDQQIPPNKLNDHENKKQLIADVEEEDKSAPITNQSTAVPKLKSQEDEKDKVKIKANASKVSKNKNDSPKSEFEQKLNSTRSKGEKESQDLISEQEKLHKIPATNDIKKADKNFKLHNSRAHKLEVNFKVVLRELQTEGGFLQEEDYVRMDKNKDSVFSVDFDIHDLTGIEEGSVHAFAQRIIQLGYKCLLSQEKELNKSKVNFQKLGKDSFWNRVKLTIEEALVNFGEEQSPKAEEKENEDLIVESKIERQILRFVRGDIILPIKDYKQTKVTEWFDLSRSATRINCVLIEHEEDLNQNQGVGEFSLEATFADEDDQKDLLTLLLNKLSNKEDDLFKPIGKMKAIQIEPEYFLAKNGKKTLKVISKPNIEEELKNFGDFTKIKGLEFYNPCGRVKFLYEIRLSKVTNCQNVVNIEPFQVDFDPLFLEELRESNFNEARSLEIEITMFNIPQKYWYHAATSVAKNWGSESCFNLYQKDSITFKADLSKPANC